LHHNHLPPFAALCASAAARHVASPGFFKYAAIARFTSLIVTRIINAPHAEQRNLPTSLGTLPSWPH
jgi:hypothetical protein